MQTAAQELRRSFFPATNSSECRMPNAKCRNNDEIRMTKETIPRDHHSIIRASFVIRHSSFVIFWSLASLRRGRLEFLAENEMAAGTHRRSHHSDACADT